MQWAAKQKGFTIVELLIVVVVIAILAAITIVAYNGIVRQSEETVLKAELRQVAGTITTYELKNATLPTSLAQAEVKIPTNQALIYSSQGSTYCVSASSIRTPSIRYFVTQEGTIQEGICPGHGPLTDGLAIQLVSRLQCDELPVFTGANTSAIRTTTDARGNTTRSYRIARLPDNNCWMLDNLKLGSSTGSITLTSTDTNVVSNFALPQMITSGMESYDLPQVAGPIATDTGAGTTNYGYLYNWSAATAGGSRATHPAASGAANYSICPANWRLPTGNTTGEVAMLNAKMNNPSATAPSTTGSAAFAQYWQNGSIFKGVYAGSWWRAFSGAASVGNYWTRTAHTGSADYAFYYYFNSGSVSPSANGDRSNAYAIRCILG